MPVITISRTLGSGGGEIGRLLAKRLKYRCFDREEFARAARQHKYLRAELAVLDEKSVPLFDTLFRDRPKEFLALLHETICDVADAGDAVIVGRGGQAILRDLGSAFHVRVDAPVEARVARLEGKWGVSEAEARRRIRDVDAERGRFVRQAFGADWADPREYHLVINTGRVDVPTAAKMILAGFRQVDWRERTGEAKGVLQRFRLARAIRGSLIRHPEITCPTCVDVRVDAQGTVTLEGRLTEPRDKALIENAARKVKGVARVVNRLRP